MKAPRDHRRQQFLDDCFCEGHWDGDWFKHHGVAPYEPSLQSNGQRIKLTAADAVASYRAGFKQAAGTRFEDARQ